MKKQKTRTKPPGPIIQDGMEFTELDIYNLHLEWKHQDRLVGYYGGELALARLRWEQARNTASVFEAETARRIRQKPKNYGVSRLTEAAIKEAVSIELLTSTAHDKVLRAKYKMDLLEVAMKRFEHRKKAISDCVFLHGQQYYSEPKLPKGINEKQKDKMIRGLKH